MESDKIRMKTIKKYIIGKIFKKVLQDFGKESIIDIVKNLQLG